MFLRLIMFPTSVYLICRQYRCMESVQLSAKKLEFIFLNVFFYALIISLTPWVMGVYLFIDVLCFFGWIFFVGFTLSVLFLTVLKNEKMK